MLTLMLRLTTTTATPQRVIGNSTAYQMFQKSFEISLKLLFKDFGEGEKLVPLSR